LNFRHIAALLALALLAGGCTATSISPRQKIGRELQTAKLSFEGYRAFKKNDPVGTVKQGIKEFQESFEDYLDSVYLDDKEKEPHQILVKRPVDTRISSRYGVRKLKFERRARTHYGIDFSAPKGTPIAAAGSGQVVFVGWRGAYGKVVEVDHGEGLTTLYAHMDKYLVKPKQKVRPGAILGLVGNTGRSTGPHLHFEMRVDNKPLDPLEFLPWA